MFYICLSSCHECTCLQHCSDMPLELRHSVHVRRFQTSTATTTLVSAFLFSRIYYLSTLLFCSTHDVTTRLQRIQSYAARVILRLPSSSSITAHLKSLHWLPVNVRSTYEIACMCYHCHSSTAPSYVTDMRHHMSLTCCRKIRHSPAVLAPAHH